MSDIGGLFITFKFFPQIVWVDDKEGILLGCNQTKSMAMATATAAEKRRTVWLAPSMASEPKCRMTRDCKASSTTKGMMATIQGIGFMAGIE